ncbi:MAG TPA: DUF58 domain-containing protein [Thermoplasmataceae archaeon]|nr:DUF58 domain-containing protein [Thermoplasmatales archaeon AK]HLH86462.1 DUF58 domain-containing protein [Thermoplasmataceae archaeon]
MIKKSGYALLGVLTYGILESLIFGYNYFIIFTLVMFFVVSSDIILFNVGQGRDIKKIITERTLLSDHSRKNQWVQVSVSFRNNGRRGIRFRYYDTLSDIFLSKGDFEGEMVLRPGETRTVNYQISSQAIGKYQIGPLRLYTEDPMKLCLVNDIAEKPNEIQISPSASELFSQRSERLSNFLFTVGIHFSKKSGQGYDFYGIRDYTESDDFRYIAWNRYGSVTGEDLYIKQMEEERQIDVYFVLDYSDGMNQGFGSRRMYDHVVTSVLNAAYNIARNHDGVGFMVKSTTQEMFIAARKTQEPIKEMEKRIASMRPSGDFRMESVVEQLKRNIRKNAVVFIISPLAYAENLRVLDKRALTSGHPKYLFILDQYFYAELPRDQVERKLMMSLEVKHRKNLQAVSKFFNSVGIKSSIVGRDDLLLRLMVEYEYARNMNLGS